MCDKLVNFSLHGPSSRDATTIAAARMLLKRMEVRGTCGMLAKAAPMKQSSLTRMLKPESRNKLNLFVYLSGS